jgi:hypothetical protein
MIAKEAFARCNVICDQGFFAFEDKLESISLERLTFLLCSRVSFPLKKDFIDYVVFALVNTTMTKYVQLALAKCLITIYTFNMWMSKEAHMMFLWWLLISFPPIGSPSTLSLACLMPMIQVVLLWL